MLNLSALAPGAVRYNADLCIDFSRFSRYLISVADIDSGVSAGTLDLAGRTSAPADIAAGTGKYNISNTNSSGTVAQTDGTGADTWTLFNGNYSSSGDLSMEIRLWASSTNVYGRWSGFCNQDTGTVSELRGAGKFAVSTMRGFALVNSLGNITIGSLKMWAFR